MRMAEFVATARVFNMGITGGIRLHPDKWRVVINRYNAAPIILPFNTREEAIDCYRSKPYLEVEGFSGAHVEHPNDYTPTRRRLTLYGQLPEEAKLRDAEESWHFGRWLLQTEERMDRFGMLLEIIDYEQDPNTTTVNEARQILAKWLSQEAEADERDEESNCQSEFGFCAIEADDLLRDAVDEWLRTQGLQQHIDHSCFDAWDALPEPGCGGVYFLLSLAPKGVTALKIGWSKSDIGKRVKDLKTAHPWPLRLLAWISGVPIAKETELHRRYRKLRIEGSPGGEWFHFDGDLRALVTNLRQQLRAA